MEIAALPRTPRRRPVREAPERPRETLTPQDWVTAATALLVDGGIDLVRVDVVARALQVSRGSFYWHFRDRDDLLARLLVAWRTAATDQLVERIDRAGNPARERLRELMSLPFRGRSAARAARIEQAIREWARRDEVARRAVDEVDERRIEHIAQCFLELGFDSADARSRAFLFYGWQVAESLLRRQGSDAQKAARSALLERLLTQQP